MMIQRFIRSRSPSTVQHAIPRPRVHKLTDHDLIDRLCSRASAAMT